MKYGGVPVYLSLNRSTDARCCDIEGIWFLYGDGSKPITAIFWGINRHKPSI